MTKKVVRVPDLSAQPAYVEQREPRVSLQPLSEIGRVRTALYVPMLREDELIGAILLARGEVRPFTGEQIELIKNFRRPSCHRNRECTLARGRGTQLPS